MRLGKHISALLNEYENVIVPGLGTFTTKYMPAKFIPEKKVVEAPRKIADFRAEPMDGQTPLIAYMAKQEGVTDMEARLFLEKVVREIHMTIEAGKTVELENLGHFRKKADGELQFDANPDINYLAESSGTDAVQTPEQHTEGVPVSPPHDKQEMESKQKHISHPPDKKHADDMQDMVYTDASVSETHHRTDTQNKTTMTEQEGKKQRPAALGWLLIIGIPLLVILVVLLLNFNYFFGEEGLVSNWRFFRPDKEEVAIIPEEDPDEIRDDLVEEIEEPTVPDPDTKDPDADLLAPEPGRPVYYLVVGSFRNEVKADKLVRELEALGANRASLLEKTPSHYHRVSYGFYHDLDEARRHKENLPEELRRVAWILHR